MKTLDDVLREFSPPIDTLAGRSTKKPPDTKKPFDTARFETELKRVRGRYTWWVAICIIVILSVIGAGIVALLQLAVTAIATVSGSVVVLLTALGFADRQLRTRAQIDLLLRLAPALDEATIQTVVSILAKS